MYSLPKIGVRFYCAQEAEDIAFKIHNEGLAKGQSTRRQE